MNGSRILVVDDDAAARQALIQVLRREKHVVSGAGSAREALEDLKRERFDLVITDVRMEKMDGIELLRAIKSGWPDLPVIIMTAFASIDTAIRSIHEGAYDYVSKPYEIEDLRLTVRRALDQACLMRENLALKQNLESRERELPIVGMSPPMIEVYKKIALIARADSTVLIEGESGTGKELVARAIHENSNRRDRPFFAVNCGALIDSLLESELFGHVKGAFTGAVANKQGLFETADGGVVFLDEIGATSTNMQTRLLRILEQKEIMRVGSMEKCQVDIRVIAATNKPLQQLVRAGSFREDLYYRLNVVHIEMPPLRERMADLSLLLNHFLRRHSLKMGKTIAVHDDVLDLLSRYEWPGNVRELENVIEHAVALNTSGLLTSADFAIKLPSGEESACHFSDTLYPLEEVERQYALHVLRRCDGNMTRAAEVLKIDRRTLYRMLERQSESEEPGRDGKSGASTSSA